MRTLCLLVLVVGLAVAAGDGALPVRRSTDGPYTVEVLRWAGEDALLLRHEGRSVLRRAFFSDSGHNGWVVRKVAFSPDRRWLAWQLSSAGGHQPYSNPVCVAPLDGQTVRGVLDLVRLLRTESRPGEVLHCSSHGEFTWTGPGTIRCRLRRGDPDSGEVEVVPAELDLAALTPAQQLVADAALGRGAGDPGATGWLPALTRPRSGDDDPELRKCCAALLPERAEGIEVLWTDFLDLDGDRREDAVVTVEYLEAIGPRWRTYGRTTRVYRGGQPPRARFDWHRSRVWFDLPTGRHLSHVRMTSEWIRRRFRLRRAGGTWLLDIEEFEHAADPGEGSTSGRYLVGSDRSCVAVDDLGEWRPKRP